MGFLAPWFLAGVAAVGLPIWLHLLRKHKTTPLPFSSLMFFERRTQSSIKHRRLRYLVLFALRTLLILLLVDMENEAETMEVSPEYARHEYRARMDAHIENMRTKARSAGLDYFLMDTGRPLDEGLREYLAIRRRMM